MCDRGYFLPCVVRNGGDEETQRDANWIGICGSETLTPSYKSERYLQRDEERKNQK